VPVVRIICDGGGPFGFGNLRRTATLAAEFKRQGYGVHVEAVSDQARWLLPPSPRDAGGANVWLLDIPYDADAWVDRARQSGLPVSALDFQGQAAPDLDISIFMRGTAPAVGQRLVGLCYAIVGPEFAALAPAPPGHGVVIVIGGGDQAGLGERAALVLYDQGCEVTLIDGPLATIGTALPTTVRRLAAPLDLAARMASCAWGVTSGGGAMLEMMCLGKPIHVLPRTPHEAALARTVFDRGGLLGIGLESLRAPSAEACARVAATARDLVDGRGATRIVDAVGRLLQ
jgi:spore coat polysaccharide biosynthesis predicted glycosyltransferase SpsG